MKQTLLTLCLCAVFSSSAFAQSTETTQRWSDTTRFVEGQANAGSQAVSPALAVNPRSGPMNASSLQQMQQLQAQQMQAQLQAQQSQQGQQPTSEQPQVAQQDEAELDRPPVENSDAQRLMWATDPVQNLRQEGGRLEKPVPRGFNASSQPADRLRMAEWKRHLLNLGIPESKIEFEARRLNREDFELWASKLVWWEGNEHPNLIDITH